MAVQEVSPETRKSVVVDRDLYEEKDDKMILVARTGDRVTPEVARMLGVLPIESASAPVLESKVVGPEERQRVTADSHKRLF